LQSSYTIKMFYSKDNLANYLVQGHLHLSKKDYGFFNNIKYQIQQSKPITSNQNKLFDKLLMKYNRQLSKLGHDYKLLEKLPWQNSIIDTLSEYLEAKVSIVDDKIVLRSPFNAKFINNLRKKANNIFIWNKYERAYVAEYNTYSLKLAIENVNAFYDTVKYCNKTQKILDKTKLYEDIKYWKPTLISINDNYYIVAANEHVIDATLNIKLNAQPKSLFLLSQYGISIHESLLTDDFLKFSANFFVTIDLDKLDLLCKYLKDLEIETVILARDIVYNKQVSDEIRKVFLGTDIVCTSSLNNSKGKSVILYYNRNRTAEHYEQPKRSVSKFITITNSRPISIK